MAEDEIKVKSLYKSLKVFECFKAETPELGITQISEMLGLNKSNVYNIVSTFEHAGYLEKDEATGKYKMGLKILEFAYIINENLGYQRAVYKILENLSKQIDVIIYFAVPKGGDILYLSATYPDNGNYDYPARLIMGEKAPMYCTAIGKAIVSIISSTKRE
jgi:IclR family KDG regulon transcriptional repressor